MKQRRPYADYAARLLTCLLLFAAGYQLLARSPIAWRLREDVPGGVSGVLMIMAALVAFPPLLARKRFLGACLFASILLSAFGSHWWTRIQWEEVVTESNFALDATPRFNDYLLAMTPMVVTISYLALSSWSRIRADLLTREADRDQAAHAAASSFLNGSFSLVVSLAAGIAFAALLASGLLSYGIPHAWGVIAFVSAMVLVVGVVQLLGQDMRRFGQQSGAPFTTPTEKRTKVARKLRRGSGQV